MQVSADLLERVHLTFMLRRAPPTGFPQAHFIYLFSGAGDRTQGLYHPATPQPFLFYILRQGLIKLPRLALNLSSSCFSLAGIRGVTTTPGMKALFCLLHLLPS